jgi:hypothetical protein
VGNAGRRRCKPLSVREGSHRGVPPGPPLQEDIEDKKSEKKERGRERKQSQQTLFPILHTAKDHLRGGRLCRLRLHSLSEYSSKQENEKKRKAKDRSEQELNSQLEKVRGKAVEHRFLILTTGEATGSGDSQAREEQSPSEFAKTASPCGIYLRQYDPAELNCPTHEQELLAIIAALGRRQLTFSGSN